MQIGRLVNQVVAGRFGKTILELGGNNAMIVMDDADLDMAARATLFGYTTHTAHKAHMIGTSEPLTVADSYSRRVSNLSPQAIKPG